MNSIIKTSVRAFRDIAACSFPAFAVLLCTYLSFGLLDALSAWLSAKVFDGAWKVGADRALLHDFWLLLAMLFAALFVRTLLEVLHSVAVNAWLYEKMSFHLNYRLAEHAAGLDMIGYEDAGVLERLTKARNCLQSERVPSLIMQYLQIAGASCSVAGVTAVLTSFNSWLLLLAVIGAVPELAAKTIRARKYHALREQLVPGQRLRDYLRGLFSERKAAKEMRVFGFGSHLAGKWRKLNDDINGKEWQFQRRDSALDFACELVKSACYIFCVALCIALAAHGELSPGQFGACIVAFSGMQGETARLFRMFSYIFKNHLFVKDYYDFLDKAPRCDGTHLLAEGISAITLEQVSFRYPGCDSFALRDVSLGIQCGEKIAVVGENGSGKTTLAKVLLGMYAPCNGAVSVNGINVAEIRRDSFFRQVSAIQQNFARYSLSLRENVAIADCGAVNDDARISAALAAANIEDVIEQAGGLDGMLGREFDGAELSGGQWQKLAIARGLFRECGLFVLDEPTAALDPLVESEVLRQFIEAARGKTALVISHRVGLCKLVDRILVMRGGSLVESGSHDELMQRRGYYHELFTAQQKWYDERVTVDSGR